MCVGCAATPCRDRQWILSFPPWAPRVSSYSLNFLENSRDSGSFLLQRVSSYSVPLCIFLPHFRTRRCLILIRVSRWWFFRTLLGIKPFWLGFSESPLVRCLPIRQVILHVPQIGITFHRICTPTFIQTWLQHYSRGAFLYSAHCSFSNPICFRTARCWRTMISR